MSPWPKGGGKGPQAKQNGTENAQKAFGAAWAAASPDLAMNGKGKSKGKGTQSTPSSKEKAPSTSLKQGQWLCKWIECRWAQEGKPNHGFRKTYGCCQTQKSDAMNPPWSQRVKPQGALSTSLRQEQAKKSAAESHKKTAAAAAAESSKKEQSVTNLIPS